MINVWISASYSLGGMVRGQGLWCAPSLGLAGQTGIAVATDAEDALRVGCALAILDAFSNVGEGVVLHIPATPKPYWLLGSMYPVPLGARTERLQYVTVIDNWRKQHPSGFIISDRDVISMDVLKQRAPMCMDYDMYSADCQKCSYPSERACGVKGGSNA